MSASVLFMTLLGVMKICVGIYTYHFIAEAAREGTRYAMVHGSSCIASLTSCTATSDDIQTYVRSLGYPAIVPASMSVATTWAGYPSGVVCTPSTTCNNPGNLATVTVTYQFPLLIPFLPSRTLTMSSTSAMIISQ